MTHPANPEQPKKPTEQQTGIFDDLYTDRYDDLVERIIEQATNQRSGTAGAHEADPLAAALSSNELLPGSEAFAHMELERFEAELKHLKSLGFVRISIAYEDLEVQLDPKTDEYYIDTISEMDTTRPTRNFEIRCAPDMADSVPPLYIPKSLKTELIVIENMSILSIPKKVKSCTIRGKGIKEIVLPDSAEYVTIEKTSLEEVPPLPEDLKSLTITGNESLTALPKLPEALSVLTAHGNHLNYPVDQLPLSLSGYRAYDKDVYSFKERRQLKKRKTTVSYEPIPRYY